MMEKGQRLPGFTLEDSAGQSRSLNAAPGGTRRSLVCFVKEDCPTCREVMPVLNALYRSFADHVDFFVAGQSIDGNRKLAAEFDLNFALLDDSELNASFAYDIDTVPSLFLASPDGTLYEQLVGMVREEWKALSDTLAGNLACAPPDLDWAALPAWRPGCGSLSVDPLIAEKLRARADNSPLRARRVEIAPADDEFEFLFDQGFSDGLPLVPPTPERVLRMLSGTRRDAQEQIGQMPPNMGAVTIEKIAINAVMAGCRPEYLPVVIAAAEAVLTEEYNIHGVMATTMGASPVMVVNGPVRERIGMNFQLGALGQGNRANATIGRALRLLVRNVGGARPGGTERSTLGNPMKFTLCFAEHEAHNPWSPLHVERGFDAQDSVVSVFTMTSGPVLAVDQDSRSAAQLAGSLGLCAESAFHPKAHFATDVLLVLCPEHVNTLMRDNYSKADLRARMQAVTARPVLELVENEVSAVGFKRATFDAMDEEARARLIPKFRRPEDIHIVVAGAGAGKFSGVFHGWATGTMGSIPVSKKIEEVL